MSEEYHEAARKFALDFAGTTRRSQLPDTEKETGQQTWRKAGAVLCRIIAIGFSVILRGFLVRPALYR